MVSLPAEKALFSPQWRQGNSARMEQHICVPGSNSSAMTSVTRRRPLAPSGGGEIVRIFGEERKNIVFPSVASGKLSETSASAFQQRRERIRRVAANVFPMPTQHVANVLLMPAHIRHTRHIRHIRRVDVYFFFPSPRPVSVTGTAIGAFSHRMGMGKDAHTCTDIHIHTDIHIYTNWRQTHTHTERRR